MSIQVSPADEIQAIALLCSQQWSQPAWNQLIAARHITRTIVALFNQALESQDRTIRLKVMSMFIGRDISSSANLTAWECTQLIDQLKDKAQEKWRIYDHAARLVEYAEFAVGCEEGPEFAEGPGRNPEATHPVSIGDPEGIEIIPDHNSFPECDPPALPFLW